MSGDGGKARSTADIVADLRSWGYREGTIHAEAADRLETLHRLLTMLPDPPEGWVEPDPCNAHGIPRPAPALKVVR